MARLPDVDALGARPTPQPSRQIATVRNAGAVADAAADFGQRSGQIGEQNLERQDKLNYAAAKTALLTADAQIRQALQDDPDYSTYEKRYNEKMTAARTQAASLISNNYDRRVFDVDTKMDLARGAMEVAGLAKQKSRANDLAVGANSLEDLQATARAAPDDGTREAAIRTAGELVDGMVAKGLIEPGKAMEVRRDWHSRYVSGQIAMKIDKGDIDGARATMEHFGDKLDTATFLQLSRALNDEHDAQAVLSAASAGMGKPLVNAPGDVPTAIKRMFPGVKVTSFKRTRIEQDALIASGATAAKNSHHLDGHAIDVKPIDGMTFNDYVKTLRANGVNVIEALDETGKGKGQGTGAHWHVAWAGVPAALAPTVEAAVSRGIAALGPNATAKQIEGVRGEVVKRWQLHEAAERDAEDNAVEVAQSAMLKNGGNWYALPASIRSSVNPKYVPGLINYGEGLVPSAPKRETDPSEYVRLTDMAATNPTAFARINPIEYRGKFSEGDWEALVQHRAKIKAGGPGADASSLLGDIRSVTKPMLESRGLTAKGLRTRDVEGRQAVNARIYNFEKALSGDLAVWQQNNPGKRPQIRDIQEMADRRLLSAVQNGEDRFQFELSPGAARVKIPAAARARVASIMQGVLGRPPSDQEILQAYLHEARGGS